MTEITPRHKFFIKRLKELGMYDKDSDYDGLSGKWVEELSFTLSQQRHSGQSMVLTVQLFMQLCEEWLGESPAKETPRVVTSPDKSRCKRDEGRTEELCEP